MSQARKKLPSYRRHRASGQGLVTLGGRDIYLGPHGTRLSRDNYDRVVGEWLAAGRVTAADTAAPGLCVVQLLNAFRKAGVIRPSKADAYKSVMVLVARLYGRTAINEFGPIALITVRQQMVAAGWKRKTINERVHNLRRIFRWGVAHELVDPDRLAALEAVDGLQAGMTDAAESIAIQPVAVEHVEACIRHMTPTVAAMVRLQMYAGMRGGELCSMRTADIDTSDESAFVYRPRAHKSAHLGKVREIPLGPKAIEVLRPLLLPDLNAFIFSPTRADAERRAKRTADRKTPAGRGNTIGTNRVRKPKKGPGDHYDSRTYRQAINYATWQAFPTPKHLARIRGEAAAEYRARLGPEKVAKLKAFRASVHWHPHQLRHQFGTLVINAFTAEHAQRSLGHSNLKATAIYAKLSLDKAKEVARAIG